jgi:multiple sugar transport system permease protein
MWQRNNMTIKKIPMASPALPRISKRRLIRILEPWLFLLPLMLVLALTIYPLLTAIWLGFTDKQVGFDPNFIGLENYVALLQDEVFIKATVNTLTFTIIAVFFKLILGVIMALILNENFPLRSITRGILALPWIIPTVVGVLIWFWMLNETNGVLNILLDKHIPWLSDRYFALGSVILVNIWRGFPFFGINLLAGMQSISPELYEAAKVDGANAVDRFRYITLPGLKYVMLVTATLSTIWTINDFQVVHLLTRGGPGTATQIFATLTYEIGISSLQLGRGIAVSMFMFPFIVVAIIFLVKWMNKD